ncbi:hypothetical protein MADE_1014695 [Alteromonas mediterranea DE]|uniref:Uncharacterized protein n=1 Tax=Alteromonas mediterranea (strain DSM 17117 / CIP 110805 / LMG 28347 / Deep ecotype) TaxID=1774373 RepID=F2GCB7_ALTMD|nr:hypothetical protein MADE_1014695 [Alteromonas mediterranea DE]
MYGFKLRHWKRSKKISVMSHQDIKLKVVLLKIGVDVPTPFSHPKVYY